jgi:YegS/Rv2252/BmrU family lipid kinase
VTIRTLVIVNAGARRGEEAMGTIPVALAARDMHPVIEPMGDARTLVARVRAHAPDVERVIVAGGDGTISGAAAAMLAAGKPVGILPFGTANNLARTLGIPSELEAACDVIAAGRTHRIDVGEVNGHPFLTTASLGLSVAITESLTPEAKKRWGPFAYVTTAARTVMAARRFAAEITWPGGTHLSRSVQVVVGNGRFYGSAMQVSDETRIDDHLLDLYTVEVRHWWRILALGPAIRRGRQGDKDTVQTFRADSFTVRTTRPMTVNADGELVTETPATFRVRPGALELFAPPASEAPGLGD